MLTSCDVLVVGGGVAGTAAAVSAAREGATTVLVEKDRFLGGTGYAGLLQQICGLYGTSETAPTETLNNGIAREIEEALFRRSPQRKIKRIGQVYVLPYSREDLQTVLRGLCSAEGKLSVYDDTAATAVEAREGRVSAVSLTRSGKTYSILPKSVIDCSGSGAAAVMAGAGYELSPPAVRQLAGYVIRVIGLTNADETLSIKVPYYLSLAIAEGVLRPSLKYTTFSLGELPGEGYCKLSIDADEGQEREEQARQDGTAVHQYLSSKIPAFRDSSLADASFRVLDRESRRICGEYTLTEEDVLNARKFPDGIVKNAWPIELWDRAKGTIYKYVPRGDYYEIPFRCLMVKGFSNLLTAGRNISVTHEALGSTRVMGACMALGDQAGKAAAYYVKEGKYPEGKF